MLQSCIFSQYSGSLSLWFRGAKAAIRHVSPLGGSTGQQILVFPTRCLHHDSSPKREGERERERLENTGRVLHRVRHLGSEDFSVAWPGH